MNVYIHLFTTTCFGQLLRPSSGTLTVVLKEVYCVIVKKPNGGVRVGRNMS